MESIAKIKDETKVFEDSKLFCHTCLSRGRYLNQVTDYEDICILLFSSFELNNPIEQLVVCWECIALLHKVKTFLNRARNAQNLLLVESGQHLNSLSSLTVTCQTKCDTIVYEYESNTPIDDKINIKEEIIHNKPLDDIADETNVQEECDIKHDTAFDGANDDNDSDYDVKNMKIAEAETKQYKKGIKKCKGITKDRYNIIEAVKMNGNYVIVKFEKKDLQYWLQKDKENHWYAKKNFKCDTCFIGFDDQNQLCYHMKMHSKTTTKNSEYTCEICQSSLCSDRSLARHMTHHYEYYACKVCPFTCYTMKNMYQHFKHDHGRKLECAECGLFFEKHLDMLKHCKWHNTFICDYCGKKRRNKKLLAQHIVINHTVPKCTICNTVFKHYNAYCSHMNLQHRKDHTESAYCVECDMRFDNMARYRYHIRNSVKHKGKKIYEQAQCPDCGKTYSRKIFMLYHYRLEHLKKTKYYCELCNKYFLRSHNLNQHKKYVHEGEKKPLDKICYICGRGFHTNRILINHVRTHTGERPNCCPHCPAKFVQKCAMKTHIKSVHLKIHKGAT